MAYTDVYDQINTRLNSIFSIHQYMVDPKKWDKLTAGILKLQPKGKYAITLDARMDVAAYNIYTEPLLDWVLLLYNRVFGVGEDDLLNVQKTLNLTLIPGESQSADVTIRSAAEADPSVFTYSDPLDLDGDGNPKLKTATIVSDGPGESHVAISLDPTAHTIDFIQQNSGSTVISNLSVVKYSFQVTYMEQVRDERLKAGQLIYYPDIDDIRNLLQSSIDVVAAANTGFARL